jgi:hypothetical protein
LGPYRCMCRRRRLQNRSCVTLPCAQHHQLSSLTRWHRRYMISVYFVTF